MTQATNHVTSNQDQMCPVTGLALITRPEWTDIDLGEGYTVTFQFIGPRILHSFSEGNAGLHGMENLIRERLKIIESMLGPDEPFFELRDYSKIRGLPTKAARDQLSKGMKITEKRMLGFIGYQATLPIKISLNVGKALHKAMFPARIVDTYETAVTMAVAVLGQAGYPCTTDKSALRVETRDDWFLDLKGFTNKLEVINGNIIHMVPNGFLEEAHVDPLFTMRESVIQSMNPPSRVKYFITNAAGVKGSSTRGRWYFVKRLSEWQHDHPLKMYVFYGASKWLRAAISIYKHLARFKIYAVKDFEAAMACVTNEELKNIDTAVPGHGENAQKAIPENELHQHIDDMLRFVGTINWEIDGFDAQNLLVDPQHPFSPLYDAVHLIKMDIDTLFQERKQEEEALRRAKEAAEAANRAKSQFLANMSHEIRTPMNGVLGMMDILQEASSTPMQREHVQTARECADSLLMVINNILDFSKIEAGELELECQPFNLKTIVEKACNSLRVEAEKKGLGFTSSWASDIPEILHGDSNRLCQIFNNLGGNAIKFTPKGRVAVDAILVAGDDGLVTVRFNISDTGIGIAEEHMNVLFQLFSQVDTSMSRRYGGTGIGLAVSKKLVDLMGGSIGVESQPGHGSTFWFTAVITKPDENRDNRSQLLSDTRLRHSQVYENEEAISPAPANKKSSEIRILLAEDNAINQKVTLNILNKLGYQADVATNGHEVIAALEERPYDLVLMDIQMPDMDGLETSRIIRNPSSNVPCHTIPIIAVTAHAMENDKKRCLEAGMDDYLPKPIDQNKLAEKITQWLSASQEI